MSVFIVTKAVKFICGDAGRGIVPTAYFSREAAMKEIEKMIENDTEFSIDAEVKTVESDAAHTIVINKPGTGIITYEIFELAKDVEDETARE